MKFCMRQTIKKFLWVVGLVFSLQSSWAFSLLGPSAAYTTTALPATFGDLWQAAVIGFNPFPAYNGAPPYLGADGLATGPKNIGEEYRWSTPVIYYSFDQNFADFFGADGEQAVDQAMAVLNSAFTNNPQTGQYLTNGVDGFSPGLLEYPLQSQSQNYRATALGLLDLKSQTLAVMMEQLGLADAIRYTWVLHNRYNVPNARPCPLDMVYLVTMRNLDIVASPLNQLQYSDYVNGGLYTYYIPIDLCDVTPAPPDTDAVEWPADPLNNNAPVASGGVVAEGSLNLGFFYTGLTRDDMAGLRYLYSSTNINVQTPPPNSTLVSGGGLNTTNFNVETNLTTLSLTPSVVQSNLPNLVTYTSNSTSTVRYLVQTISITPSFIYGNPPSIKTNISSSTKVTNVVSGDYFLVPTNTCGLDVVSVVSNNVASITNLLVTTTNKSGFTTNITSTSTVIVSTNHTLTVAPCVVTVSTGTNANAAKYKGIQRIQFVRVSPQDIDPLTGNLFQPITNTNTMMVVPPNSSQATPQTFQRVLAQPDILFSAADLLPGPSAVNICCSPLWAVHYFQCEQYTARSCRAGNN